MAAKQLLVAESRLFLANGAQVDARGGKNEDIDFIDCALLGAWRLEKKRFNLLAMIKLLCKEYNAQVYPRHLSFIKKIEPSSEAIKESLTNTQILLENIMRKQG